MFMDFRSLQMQFFVCFHCQNGNIGGFSLLEA